MTTRALCGAPLLACATIISLVVWQTRIEAQTSPPTTATRPERVVAMQREVTLPGGVHASLYAVSGPLDNGKLGSWNPDGSGLTTRDYRDPTLLAGQRRISASLKFPSRAAALHSIVMFGVQGAGSYSAGSSLVMGADHKMKDYVETSWTDSFPPHSAA